MQSPLRVSVIIPAYNEEKHIEACLKALQSQTYPVFEAIVIDNNSTDRTAELSKKYPFVRVISERRQGRVFARNAGFDAATGDVLARIDADIVVPGEWTERIITFYAGGKHSHQAMTGRGIFYNVGFTRFISWAYSLLGFRLFRLLTGYNSLWGSNMAILPSHWQAVKDHIHLRNDIHEDVDFAIHLHHAGIEVVYDTSNKIFARLARVKTNRGDLWEYLQWLPRTLRLHGHKTWVIAWLIDGVMIYVAVYGLLVVEWCLARFGIKV